MYQSIDDPQDGLEQKTPKRNALIWAAAVLGLILIVAIVYWTSPGVAATQETSDFTKAELATYHQAISEPQAPLRRARLQDFLTTYPSSARIGAVKAQLEVIQSYESHEWINVTDVIYDPKTPTPDKLEVIDDYANKWGGALLGGRHSEIQTLRDKLNEAAQQPELPNRKLTNQASPIPDTVPDGTLAGGPKAAPPPTESVYIQPVPIERPAVIASKAIIIPPKIRRNVNPRYPRKAMRGKVEAVVTLKLNIDDKGKVALTELVSVDAPKYRKSFVKAAERAALRTRFHPKTVDGQPTAALGVVKRYRFQLEG